MANRSRDGVKKRKKPSFGGGGGRTQETLATVDEGAKPKKGKGRTKKDERDKKAETTTATAEDNQPSNKQDLPEDVPAAGSRPEKKEKKTRKCASRALSEADDSDYKMAASDDRIPVVEAFLKRVLLRDKATESLIADFRSHKRANDFTKMTAFLANQPKNRYKDVGCLDNNRVVLDLGGQPYIHANFVGNATEPKKFICCQAPLDSTITDFWHMIAQEGCRCIVMLCNYMEKNLAKCAHYLPSTPNVPQTFGLITVTIVNSGRFTPKESSKTVINKTTLLLTWEATKPVGTTTSSPASRAQKCLQVEHLHWMDWPDRGVPAADNMPIELIQSLQQYQGNPVVVHCSAGIGRTGCLVVMDFLLGQLNKKIPWPADLLVLVTDIRQSRNNSIQTEQQFLYCHQVMINYLKKECLLTPEMVKAHTAWTTAYSKACEAFN